MMSWSAQLTGERGLVEEFILGAGGHNVKIGARTQLEHEELTTFADLNFVRDSLVEGTVHHVNSVRSLEKYITVSVLLHLDQVDTVSLGYIELHHFAIGLVDRQIDRVVTRRTHVKALDKVKVVIKNLDFGRGTVRTRHNEVVLGHNRLVDSAV